VRRRLAARDDPRGGALHLAAEVDGQRADAGLGEGVSAPARTAVALAEPHHDGSELYVLERPDELGGSAVVRLRAPRGAAGRVLLRCTVDGEPRTVEAVVDEESGG